MIYLLYYFYFMMIHYLITLKIELNNLKYYIILCKTVKMKAKILKKPSLNEILNLSKIFKLESPINLNDYKYIIVFCDKNKNVIGFVNFVENYYLNYTKTFIRQIYFIDEKYLDAIIKKMIKVMETQKYSHSYLHCDDENFDKNIIDILKSNGFDGDDFLFLYFN